MKTAAASKAGRDGAVILMKVAATKAGVESAAGKARGSWRAAAAETRRDANVAGA
jgi:hypothetical protein